MLDKLVLGLQVTLIGLVIVFIMLFLIIGVIKLLAMIIGSIEKRANNKKAKRDAKVSETLVKKQEEIAELSETEAEQEQQNDEELIAVLAAACAAVMGTEPSQVIVKSYKKVRRTAWASAGRREQMM
jgi:hypothetical protein